MNVLREMWSMLLGNPIFVLSLAVGLGLLLGKVYFGRISLGTSGALFTGLLMGVLGFETSDFYFSWNLVLFVAAVGLLSSEDIAQVLKKYGFRFMVLSVIVTGSGALVTYLLGKMVSLGPFLSAGAFTGALTSSPALGAALEVTANDPLVTVGYTVAYPFGVMAVIFFVQFIPVIFKIDLKGENEALEADLYANTDQKDERHYLNAKFQPVSFVTCIVLGTVIGYVPIPVPWVGVVNLGAAGGILLFALLAGAKRKVSFGKFELDFQMNKSALGAIRTVSLAYFLAASGLKAGPQIVGAFVNNGVALIVISCLSAAAAMFAGFFVGRYVFRMNWVLLSGAICGAMTSTPGLGAAIEAAGSDHPSAGYGAAYPVAILCMMIFTKLLLS